MSPAFIAYGLISESATEEKLKKKGSFHLQLIVLILLSDSVSTKLRVLKSCFG